MCRNKSARREEKNFRREEKHRRREEKHRFREEKRSRKAEFKIEMKNEVKRLFSTPETTQHIVNGFSNIHFNHFNNMNNLQQQISSVTVEQNVASLRTIFPECDPEYLRNCLANETRDQVAERLLSKPYPKVTSESSLTPPTAPPLPDRIDPFNDEVPPSYEESLEQSPPLPKRHQRVSSMVTLPSQQTRETPSFCPINNIISKLKPLTVEQACHKYCNTWTRPTPSNFRPQPLSQPFKVLPKDSYSIQRGFTNHYPSKELNSHNISITDWQFFINGLNSTLGANSINSDSISVSLKWVSWMNETMDKKQMEANVLVINEYLDKWNDFFFAPRKIEVQFLEDKTSTTIKNKHQPFFQYLLVKSI
ncbi:10442_t:CDS:1 [Funneliformis geosporum]|uniref:8218_t:CDS:1 n=1 Tax=Funneliformis geosporum TaxID=1117311 RepID=A0A9W4SI46_9GLOM|nr:8218_t:CDS:1 [Funneliformis geosporum]CAI2175748.1 10442_t:CDS:1 [Funneliformis geosporum]